MYDDAAKLFAREKLYLAGPECFYTNGYTLWDAMRRKAEYYGFGVSMPSDHPLDLSHEDLRENAREIFQNCARCMNESTAILVDLETFRGAEPDGGSIYELGMAYARGIRCYAYTRDKRPMVWKHQGVTIRDGGVYDVDGRILPYQDLPFATAIFGACKILEGSFDDCLQLLMLDIEQESKAAVLGIHTAGREELPPLQKKRPVVYLAGPERYAPDAEEVYARMKCVCAEYGYDVLTPLDRAREEPDVVEDNPYQRATVEFYRYQQHVRDCDIIVANLNDFRGYEPSNDVSFECGMGYQLGKKLFGYMADTRIMKERIPNYGPEREFRDECGRNAENFDYPINLMFSASMPIFQASDFSGVMEQVSRELK